MKFTSKFLSKASNWLLEQGQPIKCSVYKPVCEFHYEVLNFTTNLQTSERSSKHLCEKLAEISFQSLASKFFSIHVTLSMSTLCYPCLYFVLSLSTPVIPAVSVSKWNSLELIQ